MTPDKLSIPLTLHLTELLEDTSLCKRISAVFEDLQKVNMVIQLDITNEANRDTVGPTILALKHVNDVFLVLRTKGDAIIAAEKEKEKK